nr:reverse transcriptase domain-containing protein [Tanacetum cinerariifolium]
MVLATTSLTGFSGETIWLPLGQLRLLVTIGDADHSIREWMNFMILRSLSPYNGIIGRPGIKEIQAVPSTAHGMLKFPADGGIVTIRSTILIPVKCAMVITSSKEIPKEAGVRHENFKVALHLNFPDQEVAIGGMLYAKGRTKLCSLLKKNLDIFAWQSSDMTGVSRSVVKHLLNIREGYSPVWQKKMGQAPKRAKAIQAEDCYHLPEIDWKVESLCGYPFKCLLDANKGYHQIQLVESDEEKTAFHTGQGVYCYTKMPFSHKNVGATYQWLVDKAFDSQIGRNLEVYIDDLLTKSHTEAEMLRDIGETFQVKSLNGKLASLNRFLSKSAEKCLPLFKTLKKCIEKSNFHWTSEAEQAFKQLKQHLSKLPLLVAPKPKEELIVYLSVSYRAISAVLMTKSSNASLLRKPRIIGLGTKLYPNGKASSITSFCSQEASEVFPGASCRGYYRPTHQTNNVSFLRSRTITKMKLHVGRTQYHIPAKDVGKRTGPSGFPRRNAGRKFARRISSRNSTRSVDTLHGWIVMCGWV